VAAEVLEGVSQVVGEFPDEVALCRLVDDRLGVEYLQRALDGRGRESVRDGGENRAESPDCEQERQRLDAVPREDRHRVSRSDFERREPASHRIGLRFEVGVTDPAVGAQVYHRDSIPPERGSAFERERHG
jgi:hypothetical protein